MATQPKRAEAPMLETEMDWVWGGMAFGEGGSLGRGSIPPLQQGGFQLEHCKHSGVWAMLAPAI